MNHFKKNVSCAAHVRASVLGLLLLAICALSARPAFADDRLNTVTSKGVTVTLADSPEASANSYWQYNAATNRIFATLADSVAQSDITMTLRADTDFQLSFDYGAAYHYDNVVLNVTIDDSLYTRLFYADKSFSYVFAGGKEHKVRFTYAKDTSYEYEPSDTFYAYVKNIVATTDTDPSKVSKEMCITTEGDTLTLKYGAIQLPCYVYNSGTPTPFGEGWNVVKLDSSIKTYEQLTLDDFFCVFSPASIEGIENLNTANTVSCIEMFYACDKLQSLDLSMLNLENVTNMRYMFYGCSSLKQLKLPSSSTEKVTDMAFMFAGCTSLQSLDLSLFNTANVTDMKAMFQSCNSLRQLNVSSFSTAKVTDMRGMFYGCCELQSLDLSSFNTANVTNMFNMFNDCYKLQSLDISSFSTANVTDMGYMFDDCYELQSLDLSSFNTSNVTDMWSMFDGCKSLQSLDLSSFNTEKVQFMDFMFDGCKKLQSINLSSFNTAHKVGLYGMFVGCKSLKELDLTSFDTRYLNSLGEMFYSCDSLITIYVNDKFVINDGAVTNYMFTNCKNLIGAVAYDSTKIDGAMANYRTGYFKTYCQTGNVKHELFGDALTLDTLTLIDGETLKINAPFTAKLATHERALNGDNARTASTSNRWGSVCLPYAIKAPAACRLYTYGGFNYDADTHENVIVVQEVDTLAAGTPAFFCVSDPDVASVTFSATDAAIADSIVDNSTAPANDLYLAGTFNSREVDMGLMMEGNRMRNVQASAEQASTVDGLRAYLAVAPYPATHTPESLVFEPSVSTGITDIEPLDTMLKSGNAEIYDLNGRRIQSLQQGVCIVRTANGKAMKVLVK